MKHFFIIVNSYKDKDLMLTKSIQDYIETKGGQCGYYVSRGEENDSDCVDPEALPEQLDLIFAYSQFEVGSVDYPGSYYFRDGERVFIPNISAAITAMLKYNQ